MFEKKLDASEVVKGDAAQLVKFDEVIGYPLFNTIYVNSPTIFGSFPSLHVTTALMIAKQHGWSYYPFLMSFSAVYSQHHWVLDR